MARPEHTQDADAEPSQDVLWEADHAVNAADGRRGGEQPAMARAGGRTARTGQALTEGITSTARVPGPAGFYFADVPNRIVAMILDIIVLAVTGFLLAVLFGGLVTPPGALDSPGGELEPLAFAAVLLIVLAFSAGYFGYLWVTLRGTLGMRLLGLQVGDENDGHTIAWKRALVRWVIVGIPAVLASMAVYVPSVIGLIASVVGLIWLALLLYTVARSATKQGLHDRYAHTVMLKQRRRAT
jgi:uncharacterized RDD family membrane protein YckC